MKTDLSPMDSWRGLPLTPAQNREVLHYVARCGRAGVDWNTPELRAMLADMLRPPELVDDNGDDISHCAEDASFAASHEEPRDTSDDGR